MYKMRLFVTKIHNIIFDIQNWKFMMESTIWLALHARIECINKFTFPGHTRWSQSGKSTCKSQYSNFFGRWTHQQFPDIFSDSKIAKSLSSQRTQTTFVINGAIAPIYQGALIENRRSNPFCSNWWLIWDWSWEDQSSCCVYFNTDIGMVHTQFLDMCMCSVATAKGIISKVKSVLINHEYIMDKLCRSCCRQDIYEYGCRNSIKNSV